MAKKLRIKRITPKETFGKKLAKACSELSISWLDAQRVLEIVEPGDEKRLGVPRIPSIAAWIHGRGRDRIMINLDCKGFTYNQMRLVVMHESLHRCGLASTHLANKHAELANIVFDAIINKILFNSSVGFDNCIGRIYKPELVGNGLLRLVLPGTHHERAKCSTGDRYRYPPTPPGPTGEWARMDNTALSLYAEFEPIDPKYKDIHDAVWKSHEMPNAMSIFYRLLATATEIEVIKYSIENPFGGRYIEPRDGQDAGEAQDGDAQEEAQELDDGTVSDDIQKIAKDNEKYFSADRAYCNEQTSVFRKLFINPEDVETAAMKQFILQLETQQKMNKFLDDISIFADQFTRDPYVIYPTAETITMMAAGITDLTRMFYNNSGSQLSTFAAYIDTSPSMDPFRNKMVGMVGNIMDILPTDIYTFGGSVHECNTEKFVKGEYERHMSTYFNCVVEHLIEEDMEGAVIFTDGYSDVTPEWQEKFRKAGKKMFAVYFHETEPFEGCETLNEICEATHLFTLDPSERR